ncbi:hypothetical protein, partial [Metallibacterium scheffleri]|uniref:hypothetical protein n=1 Tax=Metallibacterium scheffleri TaxID=993689 RepID=UPI0023F17025
MATLFSKKCQNINKYNALSVATFFCFSPPCAVLNLMHGVHMKAKRANTRIHLSLPRDIHATLRDMAASQATTESAVVAAAVQMILDKDSDGNAYNAALDRRLTQFGDALMARLDLYLGELIGHLTQQVRGDLASAVASLSGA